jgi:hypothetical protein
MADFLPIGAKRNAADNSGRGNLRGKFGGGKMKAEVPANLLCSNEPRKFCAFRLSAFAMHGEGCAGDSLIYLCAK